MIFPGATSKEIAKIRDYLKLYKGQAGAALSFLIDSLRNSPCTIDNLSKKQNGALEISVTGTLEDLAKPIPDYKGGRYPYESDCGYFDSLNIPRIPTELQTTSYKAKVYLDVKRLHQIDLIRAAGGTDEFPRRYLEVIIEQKLS